MTNSKTKFISDVESFLLTTRKNKKVVLVTGVFDVLHQEHLNFLYKAKQRGDLLIIGIESDARVKKLKGKDRPINGQESRQQNLEKLNLADIVFVLPEEFELSSQHQNLIQVIKPDVLAVSSHTPNLRAKQQILQKFGGKVIVVYKRNPKISSTKIIEKLELL